MHVLTLRWFVDSHYLIVYLSVKTTLLFSSLQSCMGLHYPTLPKLAIALLYESLANSLHISPVTDTFQLLSHGLMAKSLRRLHHCWEIAVEEDPQHPSTISSEHRSRCDSYLGLLTCLLYPSLPLAVTSWQHMQLWFMDSLTFCYSSHLHSRFEHTPIRRSSMLNSRFWQTNRKSLQPSLTNWVMREE